MVGGFVNDEKKRKGANEESSPFNLRMPHKTRAKLDAVAAQLPILSTHRVAVAALDIGLAALAADPSLILRIDAHTKAAEAAPVPAEPPLVVPPSMSPRRATQPPARASVRPPLPSVPPPPRVPAELVDDAPPASPQLALIPEPPHAPTLSASKVRARLVAINATGVGVRAIGEAAGVSKSSVHNFLRGGDLTPDALDALARYVETHTKGSE